MRNVNHLSEQLLLAVKTGAPALEWIMALENLHYDHELANLGNDDHKKAFWINIYNGFYLILRTENKLGKPSIFRNKQIRIAGIRFSLDDIEHGILRRYRHKYSLGFLPRFFIPAHIKKLAVTKVDYRIHFALNCGAKSCPPIALFTANTINQQLVLATQSFLEIETKIDTLNRQIFITPLFKWFFFDFKGRKGIREILQNHFNFETANYKLRFSKYDWSENLNNFNEQTFKNIV